MTSEKTRTYCTSWKSAIDTFAPREASSLAVARPIPDAPPVIAITLSLKSAEEGILTAEYNMVKRGMITRMVGMEERQQELEK
jgi:hypothetical protein